MCEIFPSLDVTSFVLNAFIELLEIEIEAELVSRVRVYSIDVLYKMNVLFNFDKKKY